MKYISYLMQIATCFWTCKNIIIGYLFRPNKNWTQAIFQRGTPSARLIFNSMFVVVVLYCVQLLSKETFFKVVTHQQYIGCLVKTQWKNSAQTIFQGVSPSATLILNSMFFFVVALYCVKLLPEVANFQTFLLPFCFSKAFFFLLS